MISCCVNHTPMHTIDLNNTWRFTLDTGNRGLEEAWYQSAESLSENSTEITVPSCWEEQIEDYEGVAWYSKEVQIPIEEKGAVCRLCFAAANYRTSLWINGKAVDSHEGGYTPFEFQIEDFLRFGEANHFAIRVVGPIVTKNIHIDDLGPNDMPHWRGGLTAGIWQPLHLEFNAHAWIDQSFYQPNRKTDGFEVETTLHCNASDQIEAVLELQLFDAADVPVFEKKEPLVIEPGKNTVQQFLQLENPQLWSCQNPHLYRAEMSLLIDGQLVSQSKQRIGLRHFTFREGRFYLNGEAIYLRGGFWEGVYAKHQSYPEDRAVVRKEIALAQKAGLNLLRPWRRPVPPIILEEADAAGMLIITSPAVECMSCWPTAKPETPQRIENEIRQLILRDRNHACIIWWEMFNEVTRVELARMIPAMALMARELDPTRLVLDESGGWAEGAHFYLPHSRKRQRLCELHSYVRAPLDQNHWELYQNIGSVDTVEGNTQINAGTPIFMSEFGFGGWPEIETNYRLFQEQSNPKLPAYRHHEKLTKDMSEALIACELQSVFPDVDSICRATQEVQARGNRRQLDALLANPAVSGYCIHAFTDGDWILGAGLIDHWQRPKSAYHAIADGNQYPHLLCFVEERNLEKVKDVAMRIVFRDPDKSVPARIELSAGEQTVTAVLGNWDDSSGLIQQTVNLPAKLLSEGRNTVSVGAYTADDALLRSSTVELFVLDPRPMNEAPELPTVVYDPHNNLAGWRKKQPFETIQLESWNFNGERCIYVFASEDVAKPEDLDSVRRALQEVHAGTATAIFLEPPSTHEAAAMIREYDGCPVTDEAENRLLQSGIFPFDLIARPSFSFWEGTAHSVKAHPIFKGLPTDCLMDEPYQEVAPAESFYELNAEEAPAHSITWYRPEDIATKTEKRTYLGGEDLWHGTNLAVKYHGLGKILLSTLIIRSKASKDPVAARILENMVHYADQLNIGTLNAKETGFETSGVRA